MCDHFSKILFLENFALLFLFFFFKEDCTKYDGFLLKLEEDTRVLSGVSFRKR